MSNIAFQLISLRRLLRLRDPLFSSCRTRNAQYSAILIGQSTMIQHQRMQKILEHLTDEDVLTVGQAVQLLPSSRATIRRDFDLLANQGLVRRVRGGGGGLDEEK